MKSSFQCLGLPRIWFPLKVLITSVLLLMRRSVNTAVHSPRVHCQLSASTLKSNVLREKRQAVSSARSVANSGWTSTKDIIVYSHSSPTRLIQYRYREPRCFPFTLATFLKCLTRTTRGLLATISMTARIRAALCHI